MQEARKVRAYQSLQQCPLCGDPHGLTIEIKVDKSSGKKSAYVRCSTCKFEYVFESIPSIADEFWVYSKLLDMVYTGTLSRSATASEAGSEKSKEASIEAGETVQFEVVEEE